MRKFMSYAAPLILAAGIFPTVSLAHNNEMSAKADMDINPGLHLGQLLDHGPAIDAQTGIQVKGEEDNNKNKDNDQDDNGNPVKPQVVSGTVSNVSSSGFSLTDNSGMVWTVNAGSASIMEAFGQAVSLSGVTSGSHANVQGTASGNVITANRIVVSPANTHPASGRGTVTAVSGGSFTLQLNNHGIISSATVNTNASTTVTHNGTSTTASAITVGTKVAVKGLWDEILNVLNAIKIKIF